MRQQNPVPVVLALGLGVASLLGAGGLAFWRKKEEQEQRAELEATGGQLRIINLPDWPAPAAPQTAEELATWTPEQMQRRTAEDIARYKAAYTPLIETVPIARPDEIGSNTMVIIGVAVVGAVIVGRLLK